VKLDGQRYLARGEFAGPLPNDVGGVGSYTNLVTSLGDAGFYMERFRGNDDLVARTTRQFAAADKITDLIIGWTRAEFGRERGYKKLRNFLTRTSAMTSKRGAVLPVRRGNHLVRHQRAGGIHGPVRPVFAGARLLRFSDVPELYSSDGYSALSLIQRLAAEKMGCQQQAIAKILRCSG